jgi:hypothetical protein
MKKVIRNTKALLFATIAGTSLMSFCTPTSDETPTEVQELQQAPKMTFELTEFQFGTIQQGDKVEHTFTFKNEGDAPLIINSASGSCGCTVPSYPKEAILPGTSGEIHVVFNSAGKSGMQSKYVTLKTNQGETPVKIYLKGEVKVPAAK